MDAKDKIIEELREPSAKLTAQVDEQANADMVAAPTFLAAAGTEHMLPSPKTCSAVASILDAEPCEALQEPARHKGDIDVINLSSSSLETTQNR
jgi:hypothetical protein